MLAPTFKRTKIVATIGPASSSPQVLEALYRAGTNGFRLNFSHGTHEQHGAVVRLARQIAAKHGRPVALIGDLQGPKIRVGILPTDGLPFVRGTTVRFEYGAEYDKNGVIPVQHDVSKYLKPGERIFLRDGQIEIEVEKVEKTLVTGKVLTPGLLYSNQGMNLPDTDLGGDILTDKDVADIEFAVKSDVDYIALSFVQTAQDITNLKARLTKLKADVKVIAKIETAAAVENLEEIFEATDAVMVARGDLAIETKPEAVPAVQRRMVELARRHRKPVIVATQMLESMIQSPSPTRAEVSDVATAVLEGADAVMLSGETAMGLFPVEAVTMMTRVIHYTEREQLSQAATLPRQFGEQDQANAVSAAAAVLAHQLPAKVIIAETATGRTALNISGLRPPMPIVMVTDRIRTYNQMAIFWGGKSYLHNKPEEATDHVIRQLKGAGNVVAGDALVVASGSHPGVPGGTSTVSVRVVQ
jgi:pyruvate kinase